MPHTVNRRRSHQLSFRLTDSELALWNKKQAASGLNKTEFLLKMLGGTKVKIYCFNEAVKPLYSELRKIGVNLNQIAYNTNIGQYCEAANQLLIIRNQHSEITNRIREFLDNPLKNAELKEVQ